MEKKKSDLLMVACIIIPAIIFLLFLYTDVMETTRHGLTLWNALFSGRLSDFYIMNSNITISDQFGISIAAIYDLPVYIVTAIWNLPLWIYEKITGSYALDSIVGVLWAKSISVPFLIGIFLCMTKIGEKVKGDTYPWTLSLMMMMTSVFLFTPVLVMGQYDSMALLFIMLGVLYYIEGDMRRFIFWFAIAMPFKLFALFVFIPLLLLKEKRVLNVFIYVVSGCAFLVICKLIKGLFFVQDTSGADYVSGHLMTFIFQSQLGLVYGSSSIFVLLFLGVCLFCYFKKTPDKDEMGRWALYISFLGLLTFFVGSLTHPQWSLLLLPFVVLLVCCAKEDQIKNGLLLDTILSTGLLLAQIVYYFWVFNVKTSVFTLAGKMFYSGQKDLNYSLRDLLSSIFQGIDVSNLNLIGGGIFWAGSLFFLFWSYPNMNEEKLAQTDLSCRGLILIRLMLMVIVAASLIMIL